MSHSIFFPSLSLDEKISPLFFLRPLSFTRERSPLLLSPPLSFKEQLEFFSLDHKLSTQPHGCRARGGARRSDRRAAAKRRSSCDDEDVHRRRCRKAVQVVSPRSFIRRRLSSSLSKILISYFLSLKSESKRTPRKGLKMATKLLAFPIACLAVVLVAQNSSSLLNPDLLFSQTKTKTQQRGPRHLRDR